MTRDEEIRLGLRNAGVPEYAFSTTLVKENQSKLREFITERILTKKGLFLYSKPKLAAQARKSFYLVAKELFLSGTTVCCIPLSRLVEALNAEDYSGDAVMIDKVRSVFLLDFYEGGTGFPLNAYDAAKVRSWIRSKIEGGGMVSMLSDTTLDKCSDWWPASFLGFIHENAIVHELVQHE